MSPLITDPPIPIPVVNQKFVSNDTHRSHTYSLLFMINRCLIHHSIRFHCRLKVFCFWNSKFKIIIVKFGIQLTRPKNDFRIHVLKVKIDMLTALQLNFASKSRQIDVLTLSLIYNFSSIYEGLSY